VVGGFVESVDSVCLVGSISVGWAVRWVFGEMGRVRPLLNLVAVSLGWTAYVELRMVRWLHRGMG